MRTTAVVLAAGKGLRFQSSIPKPLALIRGVPVIIYCLEAFGRHPLINDIVVVVNPLNRERIIKAIKKFRIPKIRNIVFGGRKRQDSVRSALCALDRRTDVVLIHDGVRPFISHRIIAGVIHAAKKSGAAIAGVPVKATIKRVQRIRAGGTLAQVVAQTFDRDTLWEIQTPQAFRRALLAEAYKKFGRCKVTDDSMLVEKLGAKVRMVSGLYHNIKITTPEDLVIAEAIRGSLGKSGV